uniref:Reverse transcriptase domain-containing protein n=1 Tax=Strigamia maritima TaxID=126957 RepID=T1J6W0_STRMM
MSLSETTAMTAAILAMQEQGIIKVVSPVFGQVLSPVFPVPKPDGSVRLILNLKQFNTNLEYKHFKMASVRDAIALMQKDFFMFKLDLKNAFYLVLVYENYKKYLRFLWLGILYEYQVMSMGLAHAPRIFTKLIAPVFAHLRVLGLCGPNRLFTSYWYIKPLEAFKTGQLIKNNNDYDAIVPLYPDIKSELQRWVGIDMFTPKSLISTVSTVDIFTDASKNEWGAVWGNESKFHINVQELLAVLFTWKSFFPFNGTKHLTFHIDNLAVVSLFKNHGSSKHLLHSFGRELWEEACRHKISLFFVHVSGKENTIADFLSRNFISADGEWSLHCSVFNKLTEEFVMPSIDLFASRLHFKLKIFILGLQTPKLQRLTPLLTFGQIFHTPFLLSVSSPRSYGRSIRTKQPFYYWCYFGRRNRGFHARWKA